MPPGLDALATSVALLSLHMAACILQRALSEPRTLWAFMLLCCGNMVHKTAASFGPVPGGLAGVGARLPQWLAHCWGAKLGACCLVALQLACCSPALCGVPAALLLAR